MITSFLKKSSPLSLILVSVLMLVFFLIYQFQNLTWTNSALLILEKILMFSALLSAIFITDFIAKKNGLSKDSAYTIFFYFLFLLFFPSLLDNMNLVLSNAFVLMALRRLISMHSLKATREKIFDASLWIFIAALFHFWSILYILLVFISILFHVYRDHRNWILPFIAFFAIAIVSSLASIIFDINLIEYLNTNAIINSNIDYFTNDYQNISFSIYLTIALFFIISTLISLQNKPLVLRVSYKKVIATFFIGVLIFIISSNKSNDLLLFTFAPLAIIATSQIEVKQPRLRQNMILFILIICSLFAFFSQL